MALLLADKRSEQTKRAYRADLKDFFSGEPSEEQVRAFLTLPPGEIAKALARFRGRLLKEGKAPATINRRLAAIKSLLKFAERLGIATTDGKNLIDGERVIAYRDTRGCTLEQMRRLVNLPKAHTPKGARDRALLRLLCENALRRAEICALNIEDFEENPTPGLWITGKGRSGQKERVSLSLPTSAAIARYLALSEHRVGPLFLSLPYAEGQRGRLTTDGLYKIVRFYGRKIGLPRLSPHRLRHAAITAALDATDGNVRQVQKLSRHARLETLLRYDDNRQDMQGEVSRRLSALLEDV